ncbi:unnamed protein product, partial [Penicillium nalgiovense]
LNLSTSISFNTLIPLSFASISLKPQLIPPTIPTIPTILPFTMPHKVNNSNSTLASSGSSGSSSNDQVATEVRNLSMSSPSHPCPDLQIQPELMQTPATNPIRKPPVVIHNKGGRTYDETRPSDWDKQRWK